MHAAAASIGEEVTILDLQPDGWHTWVRRHGPAALLFARQIAPSSPAAEDAVQEGFLRFWRVREKSRDAVALLYTCIRTAALDQRRTERRRRVRETTATQTRPLWFMEDGGTENRESVQHSLAQLPEDQRAVVVLKVWSGLTFEQIAAALNEPMGTVASRYRSALEKMAGTLRTEVHDER